MKIVDFFNGLRLRYDLKFFIVIVETSLVGFLILVKNIFRKRNDPIGT